jgi:4-hydroxy-tetrahydrodipicolinate reductase
LSMTGLVIAGACGRMGARILELAQEIPGVKVKAVFERPDHPRMGQEIAPGLILEGGPTEALEKGEVVVDFTQPGAAMEHLRLAAALNKAAVVGTTGFSLEHMEEIRALSAGMRLVLAPNMSVGVNLMFKLVHDVAHVLGEGYDIEVVEVHHRLKKDAPSGTALRLAEIAAQARGGSLEEVGVYSRRGLIGRRSDAEIGIQAVRGGDIVGEHTVYFIGHGERLEVIHRAHSRDNFARGALRAAQWIVDKPNGLYDMQDVLGLK